MTRHEGSLQLTDAPGCYVISALAIGMAGIILWVALGSFARRLFDSPLLATLGVAAALGVLGLLVFLSERVYTSTVFFFAGQPDVILRRQRVLSRRTETLLVPLRNVEEAFVDSTVDSENSRFYYLALRMKDGATLRLSEIGHGTKGGRAEAAAAINEFLAWQRK